MFAKHGAPQPAQQQSGGCPASPFYNLSDLLDQRYGVRLDPRGRVVCPFCSHKTFTMTPDGRLAKCWHPSCGRCVTQHGLGQGCDSAFAQALDKIRHDWHQHLVDQEEAGNGYAWQYLTGERNVHPKVLRDLLDIGAVPSGYNVDLAFQPALDAYDQAIADLQSKLAESTQQKREIQEHTGRGKPHRKPTAKSGTRDERKCEEEIDKLQDRKRWVLEQRDRLRERVNQTSGWIAFFHTDHLHRIHSIRFRKASRFEKSFQAWAPYRARAAATGRHGTSNTGVFGNSLFSTYVGEDRKDLNRLIVVEGEINLLTMHSLAVRTANVEESEAHSGSSYANWIVAVGSSSTVDVDVLLLLLATPDAVKPMIVLQDADDAGDAMAAKITEAASVEIASPTARGQDVDEVIRSYGSDHTGAWKALQEILEERKKRLRPYQFVAEQVYRCRRKERGDSRQAFEISAQAAKIIIGDLLERGRFYQDGVACYLFLHEEKKLLALSDEDDELSCLLARHGLNRSEKIYEYVRESLHVEARTNGEPTTIYRFAYFDCKTYTLYVSNNANGVYRITAKGIALVDNGTDGVLFLANRKNEPFEFLDDESISGNLLSKAITQKINFEEDGRLSVSEQQILFEAWILSTFFREILPTRPIAALIGPKGSGKSHSLRRIGLLLFGRSFDVAAVPSKVEDFDAVVTNSHLAVFDNADAKIDWLPDRLAVCATGGTVPKRAYYTTNTLVDFRIDCFLGVTSRTPNFRREDVADRLLVFRVQRFQENHFLAESVLRNEILDRRNQLMTALLKQLQAAIRRLEETRHNEYRTSFRIADFADFVLRLADTDGELAAMESVFEKMSREQDAFTLEGDTLVELLLRWLENPSNHGRVVAAADLHKELSEQAMASRIELYCKNAKSLGMRLKNIMSNLSTFMQVKAGNDAHRKHAVYQFWPLENKLAETAAPSEVQTSVVPAKQTFAC